MMPKTRVDIQIATGVPKAKGNARSPRESWNYWVDTVRRLEIFTNQKLSTSLTLTLNNRLHLWKVFKAYMEPYEGKDEQKRPFLDIQVKSFKRALAGGILTR